MKKEEALKIIVDCAKVYRDNLANRHLLFVFQDGSVVKNIEIVCLPRNYMHLTGVALVDRSLKSADFYDLCIRGELKCSSFELNKDGTTRVKLQVLNQAMNIHKTAKMIGDYSYTKSMLVTEKIAGTVTACLGFIRERGKRNSYVPNTVLREDIRNVVDKPPKKVLAIFRKSKDEAIYRECTYLAKGVLLELIQTDILKSKVDFELVN
ncbi:MAG: PBECR4 domain-containing protein [Defluviitaleaceae bacterium]|nr:PBECR4 domain-containing protein [Defluviitaleaceae bacterium]